jgi:hypothetical protein
MKYCPKCNKDVPLNKFYKKSKSTDGYQSWCKKCSTENRIQHYKNNKDHEDFKNKKRKEERREWLTALKNNPCADCGQKFHFSAMHWDHLPEYKKSFSISSARDKNKEELLKEISKCELVCSNCHAYRTWKRGQHSIHYV